MLCSCPYTIMFRQEHETRRIIFTDHQLSITLREGGSFLFHRRCQQKLLIACLPLTLFGGVTFLPRVFWLISPTPIRPHAASCPIHTRPAAQAVLEIVIVTSVTILWEGRENCSRSVIFNLHGPSIHHFIPIAMTANAMFDALVWGAILGEPPRCGPAKHGQCS